MKVKINACIKPIIALLICIVGILIIKNLNVSAEPRAAFWSFYTFGDSEVLNTRINVQSINGKSTLVLPSTVRPDCVTLYSDFSEQHKVVVTGDKKKAEFYNGMQIDLTQFCYGEDYRLKFEYNVGSLYFQEEIKFLFSENIPAVYLISDDPIMNGRRWVESSVDKSNKATGSMVMQKNDGEVVYSGALTQIKGRGNSTWGAVKKPYQIKTETKVDLLETNNEDNTSKTWVLLANYMDPALIRNTLVLDWGKALGMKTNIENTHIDLYYDGEYRGNYMLAEKVEVGSGRVDVDDLEEKNTAANENIDIESLPIASATTDNGAIFTYCDGMASPDDVSGGYLIEMDYQERALEEICYFCTTRGQYVVVKSPEYASKEEMEYIATLYQEYEDAVYNGGTNPYTHKTYSEYVDARSVACYYLVNEFTKARDCFASSAYLSKNIGEDKMYMGPLWDYDLSLGKGNYESEEDESPTGLSPYNTQMGRELLSIAEFSELVKQIYFDEFYPLISQAAQSVTAESNFIEASAKNNAALWHSGTDWYKEIEKLNAFIYGRADSLSGILDSYSEENPYWDVLKSAWYYEDVSEATKCGYMSGMDNGFFKPESQVRRSEIAQAIYNMAKTPPVNFENLFFDVKYDDWFSDAVLWNVNSGIMSGYFGGSFRPDQYVTREELVLFLYRYLGTPPIISNNIYKYEDRYMISNSAKQAVEWAINENIIEGYNNKINPNAYLTRAELAAILVRFNAQYK